jgi:L-rhamnose mutarotase
MIEEQKHPHIKEVSVAEVPEGLKELEKPAIFYDYEVYVRGEIQIEGDPTSFEETMRSASSSKWQEVMEDEMKSMNTNDVWDLEEIPDEPKQ